MGLRAPIAYGVTVKMSSFYVEGVRGGWKLCGSWFQPPHGVAVAVSNAIAVLDNNQLTCTTTPTQHHPPTWSSAH